MYDYKKVNLGEEGSFSYYVRKFMTPFQNIDFDFQSYPRTHISGLFRDKKVRGCLLWNCIIFFSSFILAELFGWVPGSSWLGFWVINRIPKTQYCCQCYYPYKIQEDLDKDDHDKDDCKKDNLNKDTIIKKNQTKPILFFFYLSYRQNSIGHLLFFIK